MPNPVTALETICIIKNDDGPSPVSTELRKRIIDCLEKEKVLSIVLEYYLTRPISEDPSTESSQTQVETILSFIEYGLQPNVIKIKPELETAIAKGLQQRMLKPYPTYVNEAVKFEYSIIKRVSTCCRLVFGGIFLALFMNFFKHKMGEYACENPSNITQNECGQATERERGLVLLESAGFAFLFGFPLCVVVKAWNNVMNLRLIARVEHKFKKLLLQLEDEVNKKYAGLPENVLGKVSCFVNDSLKEHLKHAKKRLL